ncbi:hypothetical protein Poli38472_014366 [Pythium oligandrum]|uniref:Uncharacterized protein n=1 Tax=Pythium oligandrum TaxID=41045 RepID=A0A8K1FGG6_PYTOL|nr:hypothetical protein Poli38472_014366 [Pythium oligandrum]|eukprot:TMW57763.1 hypothetical protein Poli38472_014366 [Pythium oligandrum]
MWVKVKRPHEQNKVSPLQVLEVMELLRVMAAKEPKQWPTAVTVIHRVANQVDLTGDSIAWSISFVIDVVKQTDKGLLAALQSSNTQWDRSEAFQDAKQAIGGENGSLGTLKPTPVCLRASSASKEEVEAFLNDVNAVENGVDGLQPAVFALESIKMTASDPTTVTLLANTLSTKLYVHELCLTASAFASNDASSSNLSSVLTQLLSRPIETLQVQGEIAFEELTTLCLVLRECQGVKSLHFENVLGVDDRETSKRWRWFAYALFSRDAAHDIESIALSEAELKFYHPDEVREIVTAPDRKLLLDGGRQYDKPQPDRRRLESLILRFDDFNPDDYIEALSELVSTLLMVTSPQYFSVLCADPHKYPMNQDCLSNMGPLFGPSLSKVTPEAIVSAFAEDCDLRSLVLHDLYHGHEKLVRVV